VTFVGAYLINRRGKGGGASALEVLAERARAVPPPPGAGPLVRRKRSVAGAGHTAMKPDERCRITTAYVATRLDETRGAGRRPVLSPRSLRCAPGAALVSMGTRAPERRERAERGKGRAGRGRSAT